VSSHKCQELWPQALCRSIGVHSEILGALLCFEWHRIAHDHHSIRPVQHLPYHVGSIVPLLGRTRQCSVECRTN
jgi:hypothetical protein